MSKPSWRVISGKRNVCPSLSFHRKGRFLGAANCRCACPYPFFLIFRFFFFFYAEEIALHLLRLHPRVRSAAQLNKPEVSRLRSRIYDRDSSLKRLPPALAPSPSRPFHSLFPRSIWIHPRSNPRTHLILKCALLCRWEGETSRSITSANRP